MNHLQILTASQLDNMSDVELVAFANQEHIKHLQCKPSEYDMYVFDIDGGSDATDRKRSYHFYVQIFGCGIQNSFSYQRKINYHDLTA